MTLSRLAIVGSLVLSASLYAADPVTPPEGFKIDKDSPDLAWWRESMQTHDQRIAWWREARFGMFIHWGVYSSLGNEFEGKKGGGYAEHIQRVLKIPIPVYREKVAGQFNPTKFNADEWAKLARDAGMGYMVITSKHHDGFAMFDSKASDYNVVKATPWHHDPMKDLNEACAKQGIKFGFYYSHAFDWGEKDGTGNDWDYNNPGGDKKLHGGANWFDTEEGKPFLAPVHHYVDTKAIPQIQELIANYHPAIMWFDTPSKISPYENFRVLRAVRAAGPDVVVNGRLLRGYGDYDSTTDRPAEFPPHEGDWEGIPTTNESYGWNPLDKSQKPPAHFIQLLAKAAARGGNLLMNVGPRGDGTIDPADVEILQGIGKWMSVNRESIQGTTRTPLAVQAWGESTRKGNTLYLHVFEIPKDGKLIVGGLKSNVSNAYLLADQSKQNLGIKRLNDLDIQIDMPVSVSGSPDQVVVVNCDTEPVCDSSRLLLPGMTQTLRTFDGQLQGKGIRFGPGKKTDAYVIQWTKLDQSVWWDVRLDEPGTFAISASYDAPDSGGTYSVKIGDQTLSGTVKNGKLQSDVLGTVQLKPGRYKIEVTPIKIVGEELMNLRSVILAPEAK
jgi:alpha-L-fucosidase